MEDAQRLFGRVSTAVQKIVKRNTKPKDIVASLVQFVGACSAGSVGSGSSPSTGGPSQLSSSLTPTPSPLDGAVRGASPLSTLGSSTLDLLGGGSSALADPSIPNVTPDLEQIISILYGDSGEGASLHKEPDPKQAKEMVDLLAESDLYHGLFHHIRCVEFEGRKYFTRICEYSITQRPELLEPYVESRPLFLEQLVASYEEKDVSVALCGDAILRACLMRESICETWFNHKPSLVQPFFKYVDLPNFDISAHAFETLKLMLTYHPIPASNYLRENYIEFFSAYNALLRTSSFVVQVSAFQLLSSLLFERSNHDVMMKYVNDPENLRLAMMQLKNPNRNLQLAVFHVLKIFVPNPYKADSIVRILTNNKQKFLAFLAEFEKDTKDDVLICHKREMVDAFRALDDSTLAATASTGPQTAATHHRNGSGQSPAAV